MLATVTQEEVNVSLLFNNMASLKLAFDKFQAKASEKRCICIKNHGSRRGEYHAVCGNCRDSCALRFTPEGGFLEELVRLNDTVVARAPSDTNDVEVL